MFITLEGTEGVGKSTLILKLKEHFESLGREVTLTREPGGTKIAERLREILIATDHDEIFSLDAELLLFFAGRSQNIANNILPALTKGHVVISDRFVDSGFGYQVFARGMDRHKFRVLQENFVGVMPDVTLWLDLDVEVGMSRAVNRGKLDRFEKEKMEFFEKVRNGFRYLHGEHPERFKRIDAIQSEQDVLKSALAILKQKGAF